MKRDKNKMNKKKLFNNFHDDDVHPNWELPTIS